MFSQSTSIKTTFQPSNRWNFSTTCSRSGCYMLQKIYSDCSCPHTLFPALPGAKQSKVLSRSYHDIASMVCTFSEITSNLYPVHAQFKMTDFSQTHKLSSSQSCKPGACWSKMSHPFLLQVVSDTMHAACSGLVLVSPALWWFFHYSLLWLYFCLASTWFRLLTQAEPNFFIQKDETPKHSSYYAQHSHAHETIPYNITNSLKPNKTCMKEQAVFSPLWFWIFFFICGGWIAVGQNQRFSGTRSPRSPRSPAHTIYSMMSLLGFCSQHHLKCGYHDQ